MPLSRRTKIWLIALGIPLLLLVGGVVALKAYFTGERLKGLILPRIEEATGRSVTIADVSLSVIPSLAIEIDSLVVSNPKEGGFSERPFLSLPRLVLNIRLLPLLSGKVEIPTVQLEHPVTFLEITREGNANYRLPESEPAEEPEAGKGVTATPLLLSNVEIEGGTLEYHDHEGNSVMTVAGIDLNTHLETDTATRQARMELETSAGGFSYGSPTGMLIKDLPLRLKGRIVYKENEDRLEIANGEGAAGDILLTLAGSVATVSAGPMLDLILESPSAGIADLLSLAPREYMEKAEGMEGKGTAKIRIQVSGLVSDSTKPDIMGSVSATNASIQYASLPKPITEINLVADFTRSAKKQEFRLTQFSANLGQNPVSATMTLVNFDDPSLTMKFKGSLNLAEIGEYYPLDEGSSLSGTARADVSIAGRVSDPRSMKASGSVDLDKVTIAGEQQIRDLNGSIAFNNQVVESKRLSMSIGKSDLSLTFLIRNYLSMITDSDKEAKTTATVTMTSNHLHTADLTGEESGSGKGAENEPGEKQGGLPFPDVEMDVTATIGRLTMEKFELTDVRGSMKISNGVITLHNFSGNTFGGGIVTKGTLNLQNPEQPVFDLVLDLNSLDVHQFLPNFTSFGNRLFGDMTLTTNLKGALDDTLGLVSRSLSGQGTARLRSGKVDGVRVNEFVASMISLPDLSVINFKDWENSFSIANGRMEVKDLKITALNSDYLINGSLGFDGSLDYVLTVFLPPGTQPKLPVQGLPAGFAGQVTDLFKDPSGRIKLDFNVSGHSDNPKVSLNTSAAQKKAEDLVKQKLDAEKQKLEEELKKKAGDLLKDFDPFKKKKNP